ncbi:DUF1016 N-terminal domain-containing protein [Rubneribacter sp.]
MSELMEYTDAIQTIKQAILDAQAAAIKSVNEKQLALYYAIGGYVSENTRNGAWGSDALGAISESLKREMPGLRGFSETNLKYMRLFYEAWQPALSKRSSKESSSLTSDELL